MITYEEVFPARAKEYDGREFDYRDEPKLDGSHYLLHFQEDRNYLTSRRTSVKTGLPVEKGLSVPHFQIKLPKKFNGTVLDGEIYHDRFSAVLKIMGSGTEKAIARQKEMGNVKFRVFDILFAGGEDVRMKPLRQRLKIMEAFFNLAGSKLPVEIEMIKPCRKIKITPRNKDRFNLFISNMRAAGIQVDRFPASAKIAFYNEVVNNELEGVIRKDLDAPYMEGWWKLKKIMTVDAIIIGYKAGTGKYEGLVGAIEFGFYDKNGDIISSGFASGFPDSFRDELTENQNEWNGRVIEIICQEITDKLKCRHPRCMPDDDTGIRFRDDKDAKECTLESLQQFVAG